MKEELDQNMAYIPESNYSEEEDENVNYTKKTVANRIMYTGAKTTRKLLRGYRKLNKVAQFLKNNNEILRV